MCVLIYRRNSSPPPLHLFIPKAFSQAVGARVTVLQPSRTYGSRMVVVVLALTHCHILVRPWSLERLQQLWSGSHLQENKNMHRSISLVGAHKSKSTCVVPARYTSGGCPHPTFGTFGACRIPFRGARSLASTDALIRASSSMYHITRESVKKTSAEREIDHLPNSNCDKKTKKTLL